jgi:threonine aldolase
VIDLRSDTCSTPTGPMRAAMAGAEVGDDVYGEDPTVLALERRTAELLGQQAAVYLPTTTLANQVAIRLHTQPGDAVLCDQDAHLYRMEGGAPAALSGVLVQPLPGRSGVFTGADVRAAVPAHHPSFPVRSLPPPRLVCVENTHNGGGGAVWDREQTADVVAAATELGLARHLDGARLWHAAVATGATEAELAGPFDTVSVCFAKALGAPLGSCLAGSADLVERARRFKQVFGGGLHQAGIVAAAALYALAEHRPRLAETHRLARLLADGLAELGPVVLDPTAVRTNIVRFAVRGVTAAAVAEQARRGGVLLIPGGPDALRAVVHLGITEDDVDAALAVLAGVLRPAERLTAR